MKIAEIVRPQIAYHVTPTRNLQRIIAQGLVPKIGVRSRALSEPTPGIYLFPTMNDVENAVENWLGDQFGDTVALALLEVQIPPGSTIISGAGYEIVVTSSIPPEYIRVVSRNFG